MSKKIRCFIALFLCICLFSILFSGCEGVSSILGSDENDEPDTIKLDQDVVLYEEPDSTSLRMGSIKAGKKVEYLSTKRIDGVRWYETELGWFAIFEVTESKEPEQVKGHVILSGFARSELQLLSTSSSNAEVVGTINVGALVEIYQIKDLWAQTKQGWVLLESVYIPGRTGLKTGWCLTLVDHVGCYSEPSFDTTKLTEFRSMQRLKLYEIIDISGVSWGYSDSGWVCLDNTYLEGTVGSGACRVKVVDSTALNVRVGPNKSYDVIKALDVGSVVDVIAVVNNGSDDWGFIGDGWIYMKLTEVVED